MNNHFNTVRGLVSGFIAASSAGIYLALIKVLLLFTNISEFELIYQRSLIAFVIVAFILYYNNHSPFDMDRNVAKYAFMRVFGSASGFMLEVFAIELIPLSKAILIVNNPFITSIITYILIGESTSKHDLFCFGVCTVGVIFLTNPF